MVLDSAAGNLIKPTHQRSITKMWRALVVAGGKPNPCEWSFYVNSHDVLQQETSYDCGVFVCMFSRALVLAGPLVLKGERQGKICLFWGERPLVYVSIFDKIFSMWVMKT